MKLLFSFRASVRALLASGALIAFLPSMALAPLAHDVPTRRGIVAMHPPARPAASPPSLDTVVARCDAASTRTIGARACARAAYTFLRAKGMSRDGAAGVVGNLWVESNGVSPKSRQFGGGPGRGIAQWSVGERWRGVVALARARGVSPDTLQVQLDYLWHELTSTYKVALAAVKSAPTVRDAALAFQNKFEVPVGTATGGSPYAFNGHQHAHTHDRLHYAERVRVRT